MENQEVKFGFLETFRFIVSPKPVETSKKAVSIKRDRNPRQRWGGYKMGRSGNKEQQF